MFLFWTLFKQNFRRFNSDNIMIGFACGTAAFNMFVHCFFGKLATDQFDQLPNYLFESDWPNLPLKLQKHHILMLANAQQPLYFDGFGVLILNLETFTKVSDHVIIDYDQMNIKPNMMEQHEHIDEKRRDLMNLNFKTFS